MADEKTKIILMDLNTTIEQLGQDGGVISPSIYDTAQVARFFPFYKDVNPILNWLLEQQQSDGGWADVDRSLYRDVPTLAGSFLTLIGYLVADLAYMWLDPRISLE